MTLYIQPYPHRHMLSRWMVTQDGCPEHFLSVNVRDEEDAYTLTALIPGLKSEDVNIQVLDDVVRIEGEYKTSDGDHLLRELPDGKFRRALRLPVAMDAEKAEAKIKDGMLTLRLPKAESARPKQIKIAAK